MTVTEQAKKLRETPGFSTLPFTVILTGLEFLMDKGFSCPCAPGFNAVLISFIFIGPSLLALTVIVFNRRPCGRKSPRFKTLLFSFILPALWVFLLLFDGEYVACGMVNWEGDYVMDEGRQMKWCKPTGVNRTDLLDLTEKLTFYSRLSALALLSLLSISIMTAVICSDCKSRPVDERHETTPETSLSRSEAGGRHPSV